MSGIRVTYSGLISFMVGVTSVITGMVFTLIVTRSLTAEEFGTWNLIGGLIMYVIFIEPIISYWVTREIARGIDSGKTAIISSTVFSVGGSLSYLMIALFFAKSLNANPNVLLFAIILIPPMFLTRTLTAINLGWKPHSISYGTLCFEATKIPAGIILVYFLHMGIYGAILSTVIAYLGNIVILIIYARKKITGKIKKEFLRKWFKLSWLSTYPGIFNIAFHLDVVIFSSIAGSVVGLAFYSAAQTIANIVANSSQISQAIYPKLLEGGSKDHVQENLTRFFYFAFPLAALSIVFAKPALFVLKPIYEVAVPVVIFMTMRTFFYTIGGIYSQSLLGIEKVDINEKSTFKDYIKSKLFFVPTLTLIQNSLYVVVLALGLIFLKSTNHSLIELVIYWSIISFATQVPFTAYFYFSARKHFALKTNFKPILKYLLLSIGIFGIIYSLIDHYLIYKNSIFEFLPNVFLFAVFGIGIYLLATYIVDMKTRQLFHAIISEIRGVRN